MIKDSGARREFATGAVRDIDEGKGRCDLLPLDTVAEFCEDPVLMDVARFQETGSYTCLLDALHGFLEACSAFEGDLATMILEVSIHFSEGCKKYGENNWQKGLPINCYIDSGVRHYLKWRRGDDDERHDRAFVWNLLCCVWTIKHGGGQA